MVMHHRMVEALRCLWRWSGQATLLKVGPVKVGHSGPRHQDLSVSRDGDPTFSLVNPCQHSTTLRVQIILTYLIFKRLCC